MGSEECKELCLFLRRSRQDEHRAFVPSSNPNGVINISSTKPARWTKDSKRKSDIDRRLWNQKPTRVELDIDAPFVVRVWQKSHVHSERCSSIQSWEANTDDIADALLLQVDRLAASRGLTVLNNTELFQTVLHTSWQHRVEPTHFATVWIITIRLILKRTTLSNVVLFVE